MKKTWNYFLIATTALFAPLAAEDPLSFYPTLQIREEQVTVPFLQQLIDIFHVNAMIDMRTGEGNISSIGSNFFSEVHTIENDEKLYRQAKKFFRKKPHVHCHKGSPEQILPQIITSLGKKKPLICVEINHKAAAPAESVISALNQLQSHPPQNAVLLIGGISQLSIGELDDQETPHLDQVRSAVNRMYPHHEFWILGSIAIAYSGNEKVTVSPIVQACSLSQLRSITSAPLERFLHIENALVEAPEQEKKIIDNLQNSYLKHKTHPSTHHYLIWKGLSLLGEKDYFQASRCFHKALAKGYDHPRVYWYIAQAEYERRNFLEARRVLKLLLKADPTFEPAKEMLGKVQS